MYESKAECRLLRTLGGDAVGMSTIPEIVAAHHCNMKTLCLSLITNKVVMTGDEGSPVATHQEVLDAVAKRSVQMQTLVQQIVATMKTEILPKLPDLPVVSLEVSKEMKNQFYGEQKSSNELELNQLLIGGALVAFGALIGLLAQRKGR